MRSVVQENTIRVALALFSRYGYESVSLREIAFDAGSSLGEIEEYFGDKQGILDAVVEYVEAGTAYHCPTTDELDEMLETEAPDQVLRCVNSAYYLEDDWLLRDYYRLLHTEQYRSERIARAAHRYFIQRPMVPLLFTLNYLEDRSLIPPVDSRALAEMWNLTELVLSLLSCHEGIKLPPRLHREMDEFFIGIAIRGVRPVPTGKLNIQWRTISPDGEGGGDIAARLTDALSRFTLDNPVLSAVPQRDRLTLTLSSSYPPPGDGPLLALYTALFRGQFFQEGLDDLLLASLGRDVHTVTHTLDELARQGKIRPCDHQRLAIAYAYTMCALTMGATVCPRSAQQLDDLRTRVVTLLAGLVLNGYLTE